MTHMYVLPFGETRCLHIWDEDWGG